MVNQEIINYGAVNMCSMKYQCEKSQFLNDVKNHKMTIYRNDGVERRIRFAKPESSDMHFDLITWPGHLCYSGDMGTYVFSRLHDMFKFFRTPSGINGRNINPQYWAEKVLAGSMREGVEEYSREKFCEQVTDWVSRHEIESRPAEDASCDVKEVHRLVYEELREAIADDVLAHGEFEHDAYRAASDFSHTSQIWNLIHPDKPFEFIDFFEVDLKVFTYRFIWCCYVLAWGIEQYDAAITNQNTAEVAI
jgi:hypothetical protein